MREKEARPVGYGMIRASGFVHRPDKTCRLTNPITPSLRDEVMGGTFPGNKLPSYLHSVPSGQKLRSLLLAHIGSCSDRYRIFLNGLRPTVINRPVHTVITVCDDADVAYPNFPGVVTR
jgi:hypothetical protein